MLYIIKGLVCGIQGDVFAEMENITNIIFFMMWHHLKLRVVFSLPRNEPFVSTEGVGPHFQ